jgi:hypothetical protein
VLNRQCSGFGELEFSRLAGEVKFKPTRFAGVFLVALFVV